MAAVRPGVSFVIPVYNKAPYLKDVLAAIQDQDGDFDREYIFVDDGSSDGSADLLRALTADWPNTIIHRQDNQGSAHATNRGIERASMPFVKFVDADDLIGRPATRLLLETLIAEPGAVLAYGGTVYYPPEGPLPDLAAPVDAGERLVMPSPVRAALRNSLFNPTQFLVRTDALRRSGGCDERVVHSQEYSLTLRLARLGSFIRIDAPVAYRPAVVPGSLGTHQGRQLRRVTMACAYFLRDFPDLDVGLRDFAVRRAAGRAWKYARRNKGAGWFNSVWPWRNLLSYLPLPRDHAAFVEGCAAAFD
ncbi:glycosyltransferase family 2 protein [Ferrovibrio sp.]|uniref:glycosyltransferase family 2 protein n=1 Tax=Ferrovibrio sp. TaxID=1917215 RepID=UPI0035B07857